MIKTQYPCIIRNQAVIIDGEIIPTSLKKLIINDKDGKEIVIPQIQKQPERKICYVRIYPDTNVTNEAYSYVELPNNNLTKELILRNEAANDNNNLIIFLDDFQIHNTNWINEVHYIGNC